MAIVAALVYGHIAKRQRRDALATLAARLGMEFREDHDHQLADLYSFLDKVDQGRDRYAYNRLSGNYQGHDVMAFDFHYKTGSGKNTQHHHITVLTLMLPKSFPELLISPEGFFSKFAQAFGYDDIDFESAEFSQAFCVRSADKKFAYAVCNPQMMEYLLAWGEPMIEIQGNILALAFDACLDADEIEPQLQQLLVIRRLMPNYLFTKT